MASFTNYSEWHDVLEDARAGKMLYYQAPMDTYPHAVSVVKVYKNGSVRIDPLSNQADKFTANYQHLLRFRKRA